MTSRLDEQNLPSVAERSIELFPTERPLRPEELTGRDAVVTDVVAGLDAGVAQIVTGADKSGKTSVAAAAGAACEAAGWTVVPIDLFRQPSLDHVIRAFHAVDGDEEPPTTIGGAVERLEVAAADRGVPTLLLIDSFHEIVTTNIFGKPAEVATELRAAHDAAPNVRWLLTGGAPNSIRSLFAKDQPFHRFGRIVTLTDVSGSDWCSGLSARFARGGCPISDDALDRLVKHGEHHARVTMLIAQHTYALAAGHSLPAVDADTVDAGVASARAAERSLTEHQVARVRTLSKHALATAIRVANEESPYKNLPPAMARQTLRILESAGIVDRPKSGSYRIADPLFRRQLLDLAHGEPAGSRQPSLQLRSVSAPPPPPSAVQGAVAAGPSASAPDAEPAAAQGSEAEPALSAGVVEPDGCARDDAEDADVSATQPLGAVPADGGDEPRVPPAVRAAPVMYIEPDEPEPVVTEPEPAPVMYIEPDEPEPEPVVSAVAQTSAAPLYIEPEESDAADVQAVAAGTSNPAVGESPIIVVRHPAPAEAAAIGQRVAHVLSTTAERRDEPTTSLAAKLGRFVRHAVAREPQRYWQVEVGDRAVGGVVLRAPGAYLGRETATGVDPIAQAVFAVVTGLLLLVGLGILMLEQAWNWGAFTGLIFAVFIASAVHLAALAPRIAARARASWAARRDGGRMLEAVWSEPDELRAMFRELAQSLPGTRLTASADNAAQAAALREVGFGLQHSRLLAGVLDPDAVDPVVAEVLGPARSAIVPAARTRPPSGRGSRTAPSRRRSRPTTARTRQRPRPRAGR